MKLMRKVDVMCTANALTAFPNKCSQFMIGREFMGVNAFSASHLEILRNTFNDCPSRQFLVIQKCQADVHSKQMLGDVLM